MATQKPGFIIIRGGRLADASLRRAAAVDILIVWATIIWMVIAVWRHYRWVAVAQVPYFIWVSLATVLQLSIMVMNW